MPLNNYGVVSGRLLEYKLATKSSNHIQLLLNAGGTRFRVPVNAQSQDGSEVEYVILDPFEHPVLEGLRSLQPGFKALNSKPGGIALDYIRANLADPNRFQPLPLTKPGSDNDLNDKIEFWLTRTLRDPKNVVYAFGERWQDKPGQKPRKSYFDPEPNTGVHDIHMNQGSPKKMVRAQKQDFSKYNGVWQDGGLLFHLVAESRWVAIFLKFQSQDWHTDDETGHPLKVTPVTPVRDGRRNQPDGVVRITSAIPNPTAGQPEEVSLHNTSPQAIDLSGWSLVNRQQQSIELEGTLEANQTAVIELPEAMFSNKGDTISLLDPNGIKVDGVTYSKVQARQRGWSITF